MWTVLTRTGWNSKNKLCGKYIDKIEAFRRYCVSLRCDPGECMTNSIVYLSKKVENSRSKLSFGVRSLFRTNGWKKNGLSNFKFTQCITATLLFDTDIDLRKEIGWCQFEACGFLFLFVFSILWKNVKWVRQRSRSISREQQKWCQGWWHLTESRHGFWQSTY